MLCFALGTIAYAGHHYEQSTGHAHVVCDYCVTFGGLVDAPLPAVVIATPQLAVDIVPTPDAGAITTRPVSVAQARAPPISC